MSDRASQTYTFDTPTPPSLDVENDNGDILITCRDIATARVTITALEKRADDAVGQTSVDFNTATSKIVVRSPKHRLHSPALLIEATIPSESSLAAKTGSGDVKVEGPIQTLAARTGSGDVEARDTVQTTDIKTGSGDIRLAAVATEATAGTGSGDIGVESVGANAKLSTGSGDIAVETVGADASISTGSGEISAGRVGGRAKLSTGSGNISTTCVGGNLEASTGSGDLEAGTVDGDTKMGAGSGNIRIERAGGGVQVKNASGDIEIGVAAGLLVALDVHTLTGELSSELDATDAAGPIHGERAVDVKARSVSGNIRLHRAGPLSDTTTADTVR
ncbi:MAG: DUF4097 family beta strand repeat-containing protein [Mycobacteriales bacterium]